MLEGRKEDLQGKRCIVSGSGNVVLYAIKKIQEMGRSVVSCSDSDGSIYDAKGVDFETLRRIKEGERGRIGEYLNFQSRAERREGRKVWNVPCDAAFHAPLRMNSTARMRRP